MSCLSSLLGNGYSQKDHLMAEANPDWLPTGFRIVQDVKGEYHVQKYRRWLGWTFEFLFAEDLKALKVKWLFKHGVINIITTGEHNGR